MSLLSRRRYLEEGKEAAVPEGVERVISRCIFYPAGNAVVGHAVQQAANVIAALETRTSMIADLRNVVCAINQSP